MLPGVAHTCTPSRYELSPCLQYLFVPMSYFLTVTKQGIFYFATHRALWKPFLEKLVPTLMLSVGVMAGMFAFTYLPQLAVLVFVDGPIAVFSTVLLVLNESSTIISTVAKNWVIKDALLDIFDGTLVSKNANNLVTEGRELKSGGDSIAKLGKVLKSPFDKFSPSALVRYVMYLPLNFIPVVGTVIFVALQGRNRGKAVHDRVCPCLHPRFSCDRPINRRL